MARLITIWILALVSLFQGCQKGKKLPEGVMEKETFVEALVEMHLADATLGIKGIRNTSQKANATQYYNYLFEDLGVSRADFDSTMAYYSQRPVELDQIYEKVITQLTIKETEANQAKEQWEKQKDIASRIDSTKNFWKDKQVWLIPEKDGDTCQVAFSIDTTLNVPSFLVFEARYKIYKDDEAPDYKSFLDVLMDDDELVSVSDSLIKDGAWHFTRLEVEIPEGKEAKRISGKLFGFQGSDHFRRVEAEQLRLFQKPVELSEESLKLNSQKFKKPSKRLKQFKPLVKGKLK